MVRSLRTRGRHSSARSAASLAVRQTARGTMGMSSAGSTSRPTVVSRGRASTRSTPTDVLQPDPHRSVEQRQRDGLDASLYRSTDGGKSFDRGAGNGCTSTTTPEWIDPNNGDHIIHGCDGGVYVTYDAGKNWDHLNHVAIGQFYHVGVSSDRNYRVYGGLPGQRLVGRPEPHRWQARAAKTGCASAAATGSVAWSIRTT